MIETSAAAEIVGKLKYVEDRLARLLTSGWRQARAEAADLRREADELSEVGLSGIAARIVAVAEATTAAEALPAIALATSACRLLRLRLQSNAVPDGWSPLDQPKRRPGTDTILPISRLMLDGREVWACARSTRGQWLLVEPPFPFQPETVAAAAKPAPGIFGRLRQQLGQALGTTETVPDAPPGPWMHRRLSGTLVWRARHPLGPQGDVSLYALDRPAWVTDDADTERSGVQAFRQTLSARILVSGAPVFPMGSGFRLLELQRDDPADYVWLDPTAVDAFGATGSDKVWAIVWTEGGALVPVAIIWRPTASDPARLTHLIPGVPTDVLAMAN